MKHIYILAFLSVFILSCNQQKGLKDDEATKTEKPVYEEINKSGKITTFVDGMDVGTANIWGSNKNKDKIITKCSHNEEVTVLLSDGVYYKIKTKSGQEGWLMHGFVILDE